jgi:mono/diheme cytochrome c family protein
MKPLTGVTTDLSRSITSRLAAPQSYPTRFSNSQALVLALLLTLPLIPSAETTLERDAYLVNSIMACSNCHTPMGPNGSIEAKALAGRLVEQNSEFTAYALNITPAGPSGT